MTKSIATVLLLFLITGFNLKESEISIEPISIVPKPVKLTLGKSTYQWKGPVVIASTAESKNASESLVEFFKTKKIATSISSPGSNGGQVTLSIIENAMIGKEGYLLTVNKKGVSIQANTAAGLFYGVQSLTQLVSTDGKQVPYVEIIDYPRFTYRGLHLDVGRHMFPTTFIKKYIDLMSHHKLNYFHWGLTQDQGWRIEIKKYPKLNQVGGWRNGTIVGRYPGKGNDNIRYGGYYTQEEVREIVQYAADRYITVVPEINYPGHSSAMIAAYPELSCFPNEPTKIPDNMISTVSKNSTGKLVQETWGVFDDVLCAGNDSTFIFLENVYEEFLALFPSPYVHVGGDECPKTHWKKCPRCQQRMKENNLKDEHELQSYFIQRMEKYVNSKGKQIIGWDEILEGGLAPNATVMSWRGEKGGIEAAKQNHNVVMTPGNWCYFDHYQDSSKTEPIAIGGLTPVKEVYSYEPQPPQLSESESEFILGAQGNVWTEYIKTSDHIEYMVYPRACALAEVVWSPKESRDYNDFLQRMKVHFVRLDAWNVNYAKHLNKEFK